MTRKVFTGLLATTVATVFCGCVSTPAGYSEQTPEDVANLHKLAGDWSPSADGTMHRRLIVRGNELVEYYVYDRDVPGDNALRGELQQMHGRTRESRYQLRGRKVFGKTMADNVETKSIDWLDLRGIVSPDFNRIDLQLHATGRDGQGGTWERWVDYGALER
jgi:hypothetical protein